MRTTITTMALAVIMLSIAYFGARHLGGVGFGLGSECCDLYDFR